MQTDQELDFSNKFERDEHWLEKAKIKKKKEEKAISFFLIAFFLLFLFIIVIENV